MSNTTIATKQIKLNKVLPGYYCWQNFTRGHSFDIIKNEIGMWGIEHNDHSGDETKTDSITAATLNDARAYIIAKVYA